MIEQTRLGEMHLIILIDMYLKRVKILTLSFFLASCHNVEDDKNEKSFVPEETKGTVLYSERNLKIDMIRDINRDSQRLVGLDYQFEENILTFDFMLLEDQGMPPVKVGYRQPQFEYGEDFYWTATTTDVSVLELVAMWFDSMRLYPTDEGGSSKKDLPPNGGQKKFGQITESVVFNEIHRDDRLTVELTELEEEEYGYILRIIYTGHSDSGVVYFYYKLNQGTKGRIEVECYFPDSDVYWKGAQPVGERFMLDLMIWNGEILFG